jgi:uncharacterized protein (DUF2141 family)
MKKTVLIALLFSFLSVPVLFAQSDSLATLEITFTGIRNNRGLIVIGINDSQKGWPRNPMMDSHWEKTGLQNGRLTVKIGGLKYGTYAVSVLDDENSNLEMDKLLGIPKEGCGFSNDVKIKMSSPNFKDCSFKIDRASKKISIEMKYWGK